MKNDLISRAAAISKLVNLHEFDEGGWDINVPAIKLEDIEELPAVDAVEVVRCRDCRYWRQESLNHLHWVCTKHSTEKRTFCTLPTFFCADGRRN